MKIQTFIQAGVLYLSRSNSLFMAAPSICRLYIRAVPEDPVTAPFSEQPYLLKIVPGKMAITRAAAGILQCAGNFQRSQQFASPRGKTQSLEETMLVKSLAVAFISLALVGGAVAQTSGDGSNSSGASNGTGNNNNNGGTNTSNGTGSISNDGTAKSGTNNSSSNNTGTNAQGKTTTGGSTDCPDSSGSTSGNTTSTSGTQPKDCPK
ncbi:hypothetical protein [Candidatus Phyllobacterium onerii]|uniref:hypothetical protein n=1 Tax=Candidatus Phyllobacterium onerii TaxID=3020828 RepID=UPI00232BE1B1|nr:hypothetical protein [Phyllobacterium sp. IY22]